MESLSNQFKTETNLMATNSPYVAEWTSTSSEHKDQLFSRQGVYSHIVIWLTSIYVTLYGLILLSCIDFV